MIAKTFFFALQHKLQQSAKKKFHVSFNKNTPLNAHWIFIFVHEFQEYESVFFYVVDQHFLFTICLSEKCIFVDAGAVHESSRGLHRVCTVFFFGYHWIELVFILQLRFMISLKGHLNKGAYYSSL